MENSLIQNTNSLKNLPSDWRVFPFTNLIDDVSGGNLKTQKSEFLENGLIPIIDQGKDLIAGYIDDENVIVKTKTPHIVFGDHTRILKYIDFPFAMGADGTKVLKVKSNIEALEKYVYYFFQTLNIPETGYNRHFKYLKECLIPLPNLATQQKIANILDKADELRQYNKQLIQKYEALTQSLFLDMFGDPVKNEKGWEVKCIGEIIDFLTSGSRGWAKYYTNNGDIFLRIQNIGYNKLKLDDLCFVNTPETAEAKRTIVKTNDIIISITADLGRTAVIPENFQKAFINQHLAILRLTEENNPYYVSAFIASNGGQTLFNRLDKGGVKAGLNFTDLKSYSLFCPPISLQNQFAERVAIIEAQKQQAQEALANSEVLFQGLLQQAFNGELSMCQ